MTSTPRRWVVALPVLLGALDLTVVTAVLPAIVDELAIPLPGGFRVASWLVTGYLTAYAAAVALGGVVADRRGVRFAFVGATGIFVVGSLLVAVGTGAPTRWVLTLAFRLFEVRPDPSMAALGVLIGARCVQALGAGAVVPAAMAAVSGTASRRIQNLGLIAGVDMAGWMLGHLYGGLVVQAFDWRAVFWVNVPLGLGALWLTRRGLPVEARRAGGKWGGVILGAVGLAAFALAVSSAGALGPRLGLGLAGVALAATFFDRLVPADVLRSDRPSAVGNLLLGMLIFLVLAAVPLYVGTILESDTVRAALMTGLLLSAFTLPMAAAAPLGGWVAARAERTVVVASSVVGLGGLLACRMWGETPGSLVPGLVLAGIGFGGFLALGADRLIRHAGHDLGRASGAVIVLRLVGMALGTAFLTEWVLHRVAGLTGDLAAVRLGVMGIFDEAFLFAVGVLALLAWSMLPSRLGAD